MMNQGALVLLALENDVLNQTMATQLRATGYCARGRTPNHALESTAATLRPDVVILDARHGDMEETAATVRLLRSSGHPLVLCAVEGNASQRVAALEAGADAYIERPFTGEELELHVRALLRRSASLTNRVHRVGDLVIDEDAHVVAVGDGPVELPAKEFALLATLAAHPGTVISKRRLLEILWGYEAYDENLVEVHMSGLRRRLPPEGSRLIRTVRGVGYVLRDDLPPRSAGVRVGAGFSP